MEKQDARKSQNFRSLSSYSEFTTITPPGVHEGADVNAPSSLTSLGTRKPALSQTSADLPKAAGGK